MDLNQEYQNLLKKYKLQGWWPINGKYHPGDYSYPKNSKQRFEVCVGAILTQNTTWLNVEKALFNLQKLRAISPNKILSINENKLKEAIRSSGYFNEKVKKLKIFSEFYVNLQDKVPTRNQLLELWGIGPETADSILLYAYKIPTFVVDAYTRKVFNFDKNMKYEEIKQLFEANIEADFKIYQEYHALIVEHAKHIKD